MLSGHPSQCCFWLKDHFSLVSNMAMGIIEGSQSGSLTITLNGRLTIVLLSLPTKRNVYITGLQPRQQYIRK